MSTNDRNRVIESERESESVRTNERTRASENNDKSERERGTKKSSKREARGNNSEKSHIHADTHRYTPIYTKKKHTYTETTQRYEARKKGNTSRENTPEESLGETRVSVSTNGRFEARKGIDRERIFDPFSQMSRCCGNESRARVEQSG